MFRDHVISFSVGRPQYVVDHVQQMLDAGLDTQEDFEKEVDRLQRSMDTGIRNSFEWLDDWNMRDYLREYIAFYKE